MLRTLEIWAWKRSVQNAKKTEAGRDKILDNEKREWKLSGTHWFR